jgi:hypothetical protein
MSALHNRGDLRRPGIFALLAFLCLPLPVIAGGREALHWLSWTAIQAVPSPTFTIDNGQGRRGTITSFRWQITPFSYSWSANELVSPVSILKVNPVRRHGGSVELDLQPEIGTSDFANAGLKRSSFAIGSRTFLPLAEYGEYLSFSVGARYVFRKSLGGANVNTVAGEIGLYTLFGLIGVQLGVGADPAARYSLSFSLRAHAADRRTGRHYR